ncbi:hypothetical protein EV652_10660 [Kribbella steppae]|uniref:Uncharacterized protein n=1 Tax=Kribbella steppae TaxID=2512223 RepID=A0A4R2HI08_9ACTN|nr:hypothetical protein [Kribbella steppae]TCO28078.1 hypothetical protein EV652_10660 [Kribbella steppae]
MDITWQNGCLDHATIHPAKSTTHRIRYDDHTTELTFTHHEPTTLRAPTR